MSVQYQTIVDWDDDLRDLEYTDTDTIGLAFEGLVKYGIKINSGAPVATTKRFIPGAIIANAVTGIIYQNTGSTVSPFWSVMGSGGGGGNPSAPDTSVQYNNANAFYGDSLFTRDPVTNFSKLAREFENIDNLTTAVVAPVIFVFSVVGNFTNGCTILNTTDGTSTATCASYQTNGGGHLMILTNIIGSFSGGDTILNTTDGTSTATISISYPVNYIAGDQYYVFDFAGNTLDGQGTMVSVSGANYDLGTVSGTVNQYDILTNNIGGPSKIVGILSFVSTPTPITVNTGFYTDANFGGFAGILEGSYMHIDDGTLSMDFGVFDLIPFGGSRASAGIVSINGLGGEQTTFLISPAGPTSSIQAQVGDGSDQSTFALSAANANLEVRLASSSSVGFSSDGVNAKWYAANRTYKLPTTLPTVNQVMSVSSVVSGTITLDWANNGGGGGGSSSDPIYSIQMADGAGNFDSSPNFTWNYSTDMPMFQGQDGLFIDTNAHLYKIGRYDAAGKDAYFEIEANTVADTMSYWNTTDIFSSIMFAGMGLNDMAYGSTNYNGGITRNWQVTVDTPTQKNSGTFFGGIGLNDLQLFAVVFSGTPGDAYTVTVDGNANELFYNTLMGGTFAHNDTITDTTTGGTAIVSQDDGVGDMWIIITSGTFGPGHTIDNGAGVTAVIGSFGVLTRDTFTWSINAVSQDTHVLISAIQPQPLANGVVAQFGALTGRTNGDDWTANFGNGAIVYGTDMVGSTFTEYETVVGGTSGATAKIYYTGTAGGNMYLTSTSGIFKQGEIVTGSTSGATAQILTFIRFTDTVGITSNAVTLRSQVPIGSAIGQGLYVDYGVYTSFMSDTGHTVGEVWSFSVAVDTAKKFYISNNTITLGDVGNVGNSTKFSLDVTAGTAILNVPGTFNIYKDNATSSLFQLVGSQEWIAIGDFASYSGGTGFHQKTHVANKTFTVGIAGNNYFELDADNLRYYFGSPNLMGNETHIFMDDAAGLFQVFAGGGIGADLTIDNIALTKRFGSYQTNASFVHIDDNSGVETIQVGRDLNAGANTIWDSANGLILNHGGLVETSIRDVVYYSSNGMNLNDYIIRITGGTPGATSFDLASVAFRVGQVLEFQDFDCLAGTWDITLDAGVGNTIHSDVINRYFVMNTDGQTTRIRKMSSTSWKVI